MFPILSYNTEQPHELLPEHGFSWAFYLCFLHECLNVKAFFLLSCGGPCSQWHICLSTVRVPLGFCQVKCQVQVKNIHFTTIWYVGGYSLLQRTWRIYQLSMGQTKSSEVLQVLSPPVLMHGGLLCTYIASRLESSILSIFSINFSIFSINFSIFSIISIER